MENFDVSLVYIRCPKQVPVFCTTTTKETAAKIVLFDYDENMVLYADNSNANPEKGLEDFFQVRKVRPKGKAAITGFVDQQAYKAVDVGHSKPAVKDLDPDEPVANEPAVKTIDDVVEAAEEMTVLLLTTVVSKKEMALQVANDKARENSAVIVAVKTDS